MVEAHMWKQESHLERLRDPVEKMLAKKNKSCYIEGKKKWEVWFRLKIFYIIYFSLGHCDSFDRIEIPLKGFISPLYLIPPLWVFAHSPV